MCEKLDRLVEDRCGVPRHLRGITASLSCLTNRRNSSVCSGGIWMRLRQETRLVLASQPAPVKVLDAWDDQPGLLVSSCPSRGWPPLFRG